MSWLDKLDRKFEMCIRDSDMSTHEGSLSRCRGSHGCFM